MIEVNIQSSILIKGKKSLYFDPIKQSNKNDADYIFITHSHYDHFSKEDILKVKNDGTIIIVPYDIYDECLDMGFSKDKIIKVKPYEEYNLEGVSFKTVRAYNLDKPFHPKENNWVGYVLSFEDKRYYVAGDTDSLPENLFADIDVAFVPIGAVYTMDALEAADFINKMKPKCVIPIHYGMVVGSDDDLKQFIENVNKEIKVDVLL